jgi:hypothetical protein
MKRRAIIAAVIMVLVIPAASAFAREMGAYDSSHKWHDAEWWHKHHHKWMHEHHAEWAEHHPEWLNDGDFDEHRHWHDRDWWLKRRHDWVREHHPDW